jgi:two-component system, response regulator, stage 0 sporulation protein F
MSTVLIVEPDRSQRVFLEEELKSEGYDTLSASSGDEALSELSRTSPDMVILDAHLPGMDGFELLGRLRRRGGSPMDVVVHAARHTEPDHAASLGTNALVEKRSDLAELMTKVSQFLGQEGQVAHFSGPPPADTLAQPAPAAEAEASLDAEAEAALAAQAEASLDAEAEATLATPKVGATLTAEPEAAPAPQPPATAKLPVEERTVALASEPVEPVGAWEMHLPGGDVLKPVCFTTLLRLARERHLPPDTHVCGPLTHGVWRQARHTPRLCRLFGVCYYCEKHIAPYAVRCPACRHLIDRPAEG